MTQYYPSTVRYVFDPEKGLVQEIGDPSTVTFASGTIVEVSGVIAYVPEDPTQWAAIPTNLVQAVDYLAAGSGSGGGGGGGGTPGGSNGDIQYRVDGTTFGGVNKLRFVGGNLVGTGSFNGVFSGSLTKLENGSDYLVAGTNISLTTGSNGSVTIDGAGSIGGTIAANEVAFGIGGDAIAGSPSFTWNELGDSALRVYNNAATTNIKITAEPYMYIESSDSMNINVANFAGALGLQAGGVDLVLIGGDDGGGEKYVQTQTDVRLETQGRLTVKPATDSNVALQVKTSFDVPVFTVDTNNEIIDLAGVGLTLNGAAGNSGDVLTSQGAGAAPIWTTPIASASTGSSINVVYVAKNGSDASVSGSINSPFLTIQGAINYIESKRPSVFANDQDVVVAVAPGVYSEDITFTKPFINIMGYVPTQYSKATQLRGLVNINNTTNPGGGTGQIFGIYNFLITPPTTASANVISFSGTGNGSLILENMQVVGGGSNQSLLYVSKSAAVATNCRVKARHSIFNIETAGSAGPTANIFNVYSVFESCEIGYSGSVAGGTVLNSDSATIEFYRGTLSATTANSIVAKITGSAAATVTVGDTAVNGTSTGTNGFLLAPGAYLIGGKNAYSIATGATFVVSGSAGSNFITAFDGILAGGILYNNRISNTMTTTFASASFTKVT